MIHEDKHLSIEDFELLIDSEPDTTVSRELGDPRQKAQQHLAACEACRHLLSKHKECGRLLRQLAAETGNEAKIGDACPAESLLYELAGGLLDHDAAERLLKHVVQCDHCAPVLKTAMAILSDSTFAC